MHVSGNLAIKSQPKLRYYTISKATFYESKDMNLKFSFLSTLPNDVLSYFIAGGR